MFYLKHSSGKAVYTFSGNMMSATILREDFRQAAESQLQSYIINLTYKQYYCSL